jgi:Uma2 family endonuclease
MTADEFLALGESIDRYELVDGVVCMSPSPTYRHQKIITDIAAQIAGFLHGSPIGEVAVEIDVRLKGDLVYRPDVVYLSKEKAARCGDAITVAPDVVVEVISPDSRRYESETKRRDYEAAGVGEYWLIDPDKRLFTFLVMGAGGFEEAKANDTSYNAKLIPGFNLDLRRILQLR